MPRILIVDDERGMRITLADILRDHGFDVRTTETGERAVKLCGVGDFDVILMDVRMPGIDGAEAFRRIRQRHKDACVIMMSAYALEHLERDVMRQGATAFLRKPVDPGKLLGLIDDALKR